MPNNTNAGDVSIINEDGATVDVISYHTNRLTQFKAKTPADLIRHYELSMDNVSIFVDDSEATVNKVLRDGDLVSFQKSSTKSGR